MNFDNIPQELKDKGLWCCWKLTDKGKIPFDAVTGAMARTNDPRSFHSFDLAITNVSKYYQFDSSGKSTGGLGLGIFNGISAIDIDKCVDENGNLSELARDIVDYCQSYTEYSPSGTGIRIIFKTHSELNKATHYVNNHKLGLEIYISDQTNKYVTITGDVLYPSRIVEVDLKYILEKYMKKQVVGEATATTTKQFDVTRLPNDPKFLLLWNGKAPGSHSNESELDLALCSKIAYYVGNDPQKVNEVFMSSPYYRSKDQEHKNKWELRGDYSMRTINQAISHQITPQNTQNQPQDTLTDTGNAKMFIDEYGEILRFNTDNKKWMFWNGKFWQHDQYNNIKNLAEIVIEKMRVMAKQIDDEDVRKAMIQNVKRTLQSSGKEAMIKESQHLPGIPVTNSVFDQDPMLFNCESGVVDLRTGQLMPHDKDKMISRISSWNIDMSGTPTLWLKFLGEIFEQDVEMLNYVQRIMGYSITGSTREQCMFMLIGDGSNGKSLLLDIMNEAVGSYGATSNVDILLEKNVGGGANLGDVARLAGVRHVVTDEAKLNDKLNESAIKTLTSGIGKIVARFLYGNEFEFTPIFKIFMASNYKPIIRGTDHGIWRRIKVLPFKVIIPDHKQDKDLKDKLLAEMPQILGWMVKGCLEWQRVGLKTPAKIDKETREYREEMDVVQRWINETCEVGLAFKEKSTDLFKNFSNYVQVNKEFQLSHTMFGRNMSKKFTKRFFNGSTYYVGVKLKDQNNYRHNQKMYDEI